MTGRGSSGGSVGARSSWVDRGALTLMGVVLVLVAPTLLAAPEALSPPAFDALDPQPLTAETAPRSAAAAAAMRPAPAGRYPIGRDAGPASEQPAHQVRLGAFRIDRTEVTNAAFAEYLNALRLEMRGPFEAGRLRPRDASAEAERLLIEGARGSGRYPLIALDDAEARIRWRDGRFEAAPGFEDHPVTETTWAGARAYCRWRGARLPTEAEWEAAARGVDDRRHPWGDAPPDETRAFTSGRTGRTAPVGGRAAGASPIGARDMAGSLAEWTSTLKRPYPYRAEDGREDPSAAGERVTRGGDYRFDVSAAKLTVSFRDGFSNAPERGHRHIGFRCAADGAAS